MYVKLWAVHVLSLNIASSSCHTDDLSSDSFSDVNPLVRGRELQTGFLSGKVVFLFLHQSERGSDCLL